MQNFKRTLVYVLVLITTIFLIWLVNNAGKNIETHHSNTEHTISSSDQDKAPAPAQNLADLNWDKYFHDPKKPFILVLLQLTVIILVARFFGWLATLVGQQKVIGEILAGITLGPSILGQVAPSVNEFIFPAYSHSALYVLSQLGLILFMFIVGMEIDIEKLRGHSQKALFISHSTIAFSALLGFIFSYFIFPYMAPAGTGFTEFGLFVGVSLSITAFPVLARILEERKLLKTHLGGLLMTIAAVDDVTAWCLLAVVVGIAGASNISGIWIILGLMAVYLFIMLRVIRPWLRKFIQKQFGHSDKKSQLSISVVFLVLLISSFLTRFIGIHALFGAFIAGVIMPNANDFKDKIIHRIKDISSILLLPVFFTLAGLRAHIELLDRPLLWALFGAAVFTACLGKIGGGTLFVRLSGSSWRESLLVGSMLNTRGLMELIVLNIGLDLGIIGVELYTIMVLMALITTFMTGPLITLIGRSKNPV